jgi:hypothetical protein
VLPASIKAEVVRLLLPIARVVPPLGVIFNAPLVTFPEAVTFPVGTNNAFEVAVSAARFAAVVGEAVGVKATTPFAPYPAHSVPFTVAQPTVAPVAVLANIPSGALAPLVIVIDRKSVV